MGKNIVLCADGTGNKGGYTPDSNVYKMYHGVDIHDAHNPQVIYYDNGVGTEKNKFLRALGGAVGFVSYDAVRHFERLPDDNPDELNSPEMAFLIANTIVVFDHARQRLQVVSNADLTRVDVRTAYRRAISRIDEVVARLNAPLPDVPPPSDVPHNGLEANFTLDEYKDIVEQAVFRVVDPGAGRRSCCPRRGAGPVARRRRSGIRCTRHRRH